MIVWFDWVRMSLEQEREREQLRRREIHCLCVAGKTFKMVKKFFFFSLMGNYQSVYQESRGVMVHKSHDLVRASVFKSRFRMFFGIAGLKLYFYLTFFWI